MGADLIGWRDCDLQRPLGTNGFLQKLKMRAYMRAVESQVPEGKRENVEVTVLVNDTKRDLTYREIRAQAEGFERGIPACATCPLAGGKQLGCYQYVTYPIDARFEEVAFEFFCSQVATKDSIADQLYRDIVSKQPNQGTGWHTRRGPERSLSRLMQPLTHTWGGFFSKKRVDSAQLMASLFIPLSNAALVVGYARFWRELVAYTDAKLAAEMKQRGLSFAPDGKLNVAITEQQIPHLAAKLGADSDALQSLLTGTFDEARRLAAMMTELAPRSISEGWRLLVDS
jgi:hypothetical protein